MNPGEPPEFDEARATPGEAIAVPHEQLSSATLRAVIEAFVLREGTDYGAREVGFEQKVAQVAAQLDSGEAQIWFDPASNSVDILGSPAGS